MEKRDAASVAATSRFLESCEQPSAEFKSGPVVMVIFGGAGDLAQRKLLPALHYLYKDEKFLEELAVLGVGHTDLSDEAYRLFASSALEKFSAENYAAGESQEFLSHLYYLYGSLDDDTLIPTCLRTSGGAGSTGRPSRLKYHLLPGDPSSTLPGCRRKIEETRPVPGHLEGQADR